MRHLLAALTRLTVAGFVLVSSSLQAQDQPLNVPGGTANGAADLTLFDGVESAASNREQSPARNPRESRATTSEPEFTLVGTSRIGDTYSVIIQHRSGDAILMKAGANGNTPIPDYGDYSVVSVDTGAASIKYPGNNPCIEFPDKGVSCSDAANIARLVLSNGAPLVSTNPIADVAADQAEGEQDATDAPVNPFEALRNNQGARNGAAAQDGTVANGRFTPRRINPEDVPDGMRIIATPFGDRLVEQ